MQKTKGFVAFYKRRLPTISEQVNELVLDYMGDVSSKEIRASMSLYYYFKGITRPHYRVLPRQWGIPSC